MIKFILLTLCITFSISQTAHSKIYKWTDGDGKVHYSATPPKDTKTKAENIEEKIKFNIGKAQPTKSHHVAASKKTTKTAEEKKKLKATQDKYKNDKSQARISYCNGLKKNIYTLETNKNVNIAQKGKLKPLSNTEKMAQLAKEKSKLEKNCSGL